MANPRNTVAQSASFEGIGLQSGQPCRLIINPLGPAEQRGVCFRRLDLAGQPEIWARLSARDSRSSRTTNLRAGSAGVGTVEHLLAALVLCGVDDALVELEGPEVPIADGSAAPFVELIKNRCGIARSEGNRLTICPNRPLHLERGRSALIALPADDLRVRCLIHYSQDCSIGTQFCDLSGELENWDGEIASARTFCLKDEAEAMQANNLMLGGSLNCAVVIDGPSVLNPEGLRFPDEMVRHKALDLLGDLALTGAHVRAHVIAICPSHEINAEFAQLLAKEGQVA